MTSPSQRHFPIAPPAPEEVEGLQADYWKILKVVVAEALNDDPPRVFLVRLDRLRETVSRTWPQVRHAVHHLIATQAEAQLGPDGFAVRYDETSYLVVLGRDNTGVLDRIVSRIGAELLGRPDGAGILDVLPVTAVEENGLVCGAGTAPVAAPPAAPAMDMGAVEDDIPLVLGDAEYHYFPVWDVRRNIVLSYQCLPVWPDVGGRPLDEEQMAARFADPRMQVGLDLETLHAATTRLDEILERDAMASFLVPVHFETLIDDRVMPRYLKSLHDSAGGWMERIHFEIIRAPVDIREDRVVHAVSRIRPFCRHVFLRLRADLDADLSRFARLGVMGVGLDLYHDERAEDDVMGTLEAFAGQISAQGLHTYVLGLRSVSLSVAAVCAGFDYIGSREIAASLEPWGMDDHIIKPLDLFKTAMKAVGS